jgi:subtilisin
MNQGASRIVAGFLIALLLFNFIFYGSFFSAIFPSASGQSDDKTIQSTNDDRIEQRLDMAQKWKQVRGEKVPNQYIVVLKENTLPSNIRSDADEVRNQGANLRHVYSHAIKGFAITIPNDTVLDTILKNPRVDYVQPDLKVKGFAQILPTGINRVDADLSSAASGDGSGSVNADIAILDTGISLTNPDLNVYKQVTFVDGTTNGNDDEGHGTAVAGITAAKDDSVGVVGMAPGARLWAIKILDNNGEGFDSDIIAGVDYITQHADEIDVANMSFGGDGPDNALHTAIINSVAAGVTYTAAAGNENRDAGGTVPANFPEVISVSAIVDTDGKCGGSSSTSTSAGKDDTFAAFSNYGSVVDIAGPGVLVKTTARSGGILSFSGTSASTPHVTGAVALYKSLHPGATPSEVRNALLSSGFVPSTVCDGKGHGYFSGDRDSSREPLLYVRAGGTSDTTAPTVTSTSPANSATGITVTSSITATFSEAVQSPTVTGTTFTLKNSAGTSITGTVTLSTDSRVATFKPSSALAYSTSYTAAVTNGIKDLAGNLLTPKSWSFTTAAQSDTTSPTVTSTSPATSATGITVTSSITATFSEAVQSPTVTGTTFTLKNSAGTSITGTVTLSTDSKVATFKPSSALAYSTSYTAAVTNGIKDLAGNLLTPKSWSFTTAAASTSSCGDNLPVSAATSSGSQSTYPPTNAIDNNFNTKWYSTFIVNPWIKLDLGVQKSVCSVGIAWTDGTSRQYSFVISVSTDGTSFSNVFTGKSSGTSTSSEKYSFAESQARYVKVTVTQSHVGSASSIIQISEIDIFGKDVGAAAISADKASSSQSPTTSKNAEIPPFPSTTGTESPSSSSTNHAPVTKDDKFITKINEDLVAPILDNDIDPDGDKLSILSVLSPTTKGGTVTVNGNGSVTFIPRTDFTGSDTFSYVVFDGKGKTDEGKVHVNIKTGQQGKEQTNTKPQEAGQQDQAQEHRSTIQERQINPQMNSPPFSIDEKNSKDTGASSGGTGEETAKDRSRTIDKPPKADAGDDQTVNGETDVVLDGSKSKDKDGTVMSYKWEQVYGPNVILEHANEVKSSFVTPSITSDTVLGFKLTVSENSGVFSSDNVRVRVINMTSNDLR